MSCKFLSFSLASARHAIQNVIAQQNDKIKNYIFKPSSISSKR